MSKFRYLVRINKDPDSDWGASVPDLRGCVATGKTIDSALRRIEVAIQLHLRGMRADGMRPPKPRRRGGGSPTDGPPGRLLRHRRGRSLTVGRPAARSSNLALRGRRGCRV